MTITRNIYAYILAGLVLVITIFALLGIWDVIQWEQFVHLFWKAFYSLLTVFFSALIVLFIFSTIYKEPTKQQTTENQGAA
jgi:dolichyl-phosphate-mannose--protein O-mannosyl transferase